VAFNHIPSDGIAIAVTVESWAQIRMAIINFTVYDSHIDSLPLGIANAARWRCTYGSQRIGRELRTACILNIGI